MYTKGDFAAALDAELLAQLDLIQLSKWAYRVYLDNVHDLQPGLKEDIMKIVLMEEGPEFSLTRSELRDMARELRTAPNP